jgi:hypothetical protein
MRTGLKIGTENISYIHHMGDETKLVRNKGRVSVIIGGQCRPSTILKSPSDVAEKTALLAFVLPRGAKTV